jgi:hypothetical protein
MLSVAASKPSAALSTMIKIIAKVPHSHGKLSKSMSVFTAE